MKSARAINAQQPKHVGVVIQIIKKMLNPPEEVEKMA
jgi:hypothetical protein